MQQTAASFLDSPEFNSLFGGLNDHDYVDQLYHNALSRDADDDPSSQTWIDLLNSGGSRADVAVGISESSEHQTDTQAAFGPGVFVPNATASAIDRLYLGLLDRSADASGLVDWNTALQSGSSFHQVADGFINSDEFQSAHAGISNHDFVDLLYQNALGRDVDDDPSGQTWITALNGGGSRADVALGIAESPEATFHLLPIIEDGFILA